MFSQFRQAVESLAQHSPKSSQDASADDHAPRSSQDSVRPSLSSSALAESALMNLKKTLSSQRSGSPGPGNSSPARASTASPEGAARPVHRSTLEDRLRAKFAVGDASGTPTPTASSRSSPTPTAVLDHRLSPTSVLLPESPAPRPNSADPFHPTSVPLPDSPLTTPQADASKGHIRDVSQLSLSEVATVLAANSNSTAHDISGAEPQDLTQGDSDPLQAGILLKRDQDTEDATQSSKDSATTVGDAPSEVAVQDPLSTTEEASPSEPEGDTNAMSSVEQEEASSSQHADAEDVPTGLTEDTSAKATEDSTPAITDIIDEKDETSPVLSDPVDDTLPETAPEASVTTSEDVTVQQTAVTDPEEAHPESVPSPDVDATESNAKETVTQEDGLAGDAVTASPEADPPELKSSGLDIDALQKRLKLVEQRFADVSTSFKRLQAEKLAADRVLQELTPVETLQEADALRDYLQNVNMKIEMAQDEIKRLTGKLTRQEERIEELRDIHRLESKSQSDQIDKLRHQVEEAEALLKASHASAAALEQEAAKQKAEMERLEGEVEKARSVAKEEEEKRVKAITLLKTVRQKLVKAEKDRDDNSKEMQSMKEKEKEEREKDKAEKLALQSEIQKVNAEREAAIVGLRSQFDKEIAALKDKYEKEFTMFKSQYELEAIAAKASYTKELDNKNSRICDLEASVKRLAGEKDDLFDQLQVRQAEVESSQSHLESLEGQCTELQYQLREANDRVALLTEELAESQREQSTKVHSPGPSPEEVTRLLSATEVKYESRVSDLRRQLQIVEKERDESETQWSKRLSEKVKELEVLKGTLTTSARSREQESESVNSLKTEIQELKNEIHKHQKRIADLQHQATKVTETEEMIMAQLSDANLKASVLQQHLEESKGRESQLRMANKTLREELRKVQSSAALLERQRNPGVGYWAARQESSSEPRSPRSSIDSGSRPTSPSVDKNDEEINIEYLRNIILQFLEHKEMRPHLVRILSTILRFTPQETRRLVAKV